MVIFTLILTKYALINSIIKPSFLTHLQFSIFSMSIVLITAGGYIINDIFDIEADKINKPTIVFIDKTISKKNGFVLYYSFSFIGLLLGIYLSFSAYKPIYSFIFIGITIGLYIYSKLLKRIPIIGNIFVSILISLSLFLLYFFDASKESSLLFNIILIYIIFSFITTLIREMIKDIEDINGDYQQKMQTLPIVIGRKRAKNVVLVVTSILFIFTVVVTRFLFDESKLFFWYSILFTFVPLTYFLIKLWDAKTKRHYFFLSNLMKIIMLFGILSMVLFQFI